MVTITRSLARLLRAVLRKAELGKSGPQPDAFVHVSTDNEGLRLRAAGTEVAVEYRQPGELGTAAFVLPVEVLAIIEGRTQEPVSLDASDPSRLVIRFAEHGVPQLLERTIDRKVKQPAWPELPTTYVESSADLWTALRDAVATTDREPTRYALNCLQLRGRGDIATTDGHHILIQSGFAFATTVTKGASKKPRSQPPDLDDLSQTGIAEATRQWFLIGRRKPFDPDTGTHQLCVQVGGSAGQAVTENLTIEEGRMSKDFDGRVWRVHFDEKKLSYEQEGDLATETRIMEFLRTVPDGATMTDIRKVVRHNHEGTAKAIARLVREGKTRKATIKKATGKSTRDYDAFSLTALPPADDDDDE